MPSYGPDLVVPLYCSFTAVGIVLTTAVVIVVFAGYRRGYYPDTIVGPVVTTTGDVFDVAIDVGPQSLRLVPAALVQARPTSMHIKDECALPWRSALEIIHGDGLEDLRRLILGPLNVPFKLNEDTSVQAEDFWVRIRPSSSSSS